MRKMHPTRRRVLAYLAARDCERDEGPTTREIAEACWDGQQTGAWARPLLDSMEMQDGHVETVGWGAGRRPAGCTWRITSAGRTALDRDNQETGR